MLQQHASFSASERSYDQVQEQEECHHQEVPWSFCFAKRSRQKKKDGSAADAASWKPVSLGLPFLTCIIVACGALIAILQYLLTYSQTNKGVLFASDVNQLPVDQSFFYLYLPTILAVVFSFLWTWVDLDAKRLEPYHQLLNEQGVSGKQSLLLHYPIDFVASVPFKAVKCRHWSVFFASTAMVLIFWGLTPTQSGIFATDTVRKVIGIPMLASTSFQVLNQQDDPNSAMYAHSVSNIIWLNETLPPFMTRDFILARFGPKSPTRGTKADENWTGKTRLYSVDVECERAISWPDTPNSAGGLNSSWGCSFMQLPVRVNPSRASNKTYDSLYVGYSNDGNADYYLSGRCPKNESHSFIVQWSKILIPAAEINDMLPPEQLQHANVTTLYCRSSYYYQDVVATVASPSMSVVNVERVSPKIPLPPEIFNTSVFEGAMSVGQQKLGVRSDFPTNLWPDQVTKLLNMPLDMNYLPRMAPFAIGAYPRPLEEYLDPEVLHKSYEAAYRLLFARRMVEVLSSDLDPATENTGQRSYTTQSVVVVPVFTFIVEAFLGVVALLACFLVYTSLTRTRKLSSDPAAIASVMSLVEGQDRLLEEFKCLDRATNECIEQSVGEKKFRLLAGNSSEAVCQLQLVEDQSLGSVSMWHTSISHSNEPLISHATTTDTGPNVVDAVQPFEFRLPIGSAFIAFQVASLVLIAVLNNKINRENGLALPSSNQFVRQLVEKYIPTAIATLIEPLWLILNRLLCMLQPFEELRRGRAAPRKSVSLDYTSLPPQFVIWKALRSGHVVLAAVCGMTLLANVLAIAFSGLFFENIVEIPVPSTFSLPYSLHFQPLNGSTGPFNQQDRYGELRGTTDPFYMAMSNLTAHTPMPAWTDDKHAFLPFVLKGNEENSTWQHRAVTPAFGAQLNCSAVQAQGPMSYNLFITSDGRNGMPEVSLLRENGRVVTCDASTIGLPYGGTPAGRSAFEWNVPLTGRANASAADSSFCREHIFALWLRADISPQPKRAGSGESTLANLTLRSRHETALVCRPTLLVGLADVVVDGEGRVQKTISANMSSKDVEAKFATSASDLIGQAHQFIINEGFTWHNDSFPSDFNNYLIEKNTNSTRLIDPSLPPPSPDDAASAFGDVYSKLFAILVGTNMDMLLGPAADTNIDGYIIKPTTRIFVSKPMFVIAETILALYIVVTVILYLRRPWRILSRLPTTPASIIAWVAASRALEDVKGTARFSSTDRERHLERLGNQYGFGSFIGTDGKPHVGIEKMPFFTTLSRERSQGPQNSGAESGPVTRAKQWWSGPRRKSGRI